MTFYQRPQGFLCATGDPMTRDHHYSDHLSHCVSPQPGIEPRLTARQASMLHTRPPGGSKEDGEKEDYPGWRQPN